MPFKSDRTSAMSTCPHSVLHPEDKNMGNRGRWNFPCQIVWILIDVIALSTFISLLPTLCERRHRVRGRQTHTNEAKSLRDWRPTHPSRTRVGKQVYKCGKTVMTGESHCGFHCITLSTFLHTWHFPKKKKFEPTKRKKACSFKETAMERDENCTSSHV